MATNWAKDGLDAYLALTGEKRAQDKAESDKAYQEQSMQLAQNADARATASAGLSNQLTGLQVEEGTRKAEDRKGSSAAIRNYIRFKAGADPSLPNTLDPTELATSRQLATDLAHTGTMLDNTPPGAYELPLDKLPPSAQKVFMEGPGKAALTRTGNKHVEPGTNREYVITGPGPVRVVREEGQPAVITPTLLAKYSDDGSVKEVPFTDGTNNPDAAVKQITGADLRNRAGITLASLDQAEKGGIAPSAAYADNIYKRVEALPYEQQLAWYQAELTKDSARAEKTTYDASVAKAAEPYVKLVASLKGSAAERQDQFLTAIQGAPSSVVAYLKDNAEVSAKLFEPQAKREDAKIKADEDRAVRVENNKRDNETRRAIAAAVASGKESPTGLKAREALSSIDKDIKELHVDNRGLRKELRDADDKGRADIQRSIDENESRMKELQGEKSLLLGRKSPAAAGVDVQDEHAGNVSGAKALLGGGGKPKTLNLGGNGFNNSIFGLQ